MLAGTDQGGKRQQLREVLLPEGNQVLHEDAFSRA
jgi:hypothetical protein